jgi:Domain of unknown function (DUF4110)/Galactose oxidase, central domain/Kelch motif
MGKRDKKKQGLGKAKTEAKEAKKQSKARRKNIVDSGDQDVESILAELLAKEEADAAVKTVVNAPAPSPPRAAFTMVASPTSDNDLIFFGGERFTGERAAFFNDLHVYNIDKAGWTRYDSATRPPPRSGHAVACYKHFMFLFGGEFSNPSLSQYRHYRDLWRLDTEDMSWEKLDLRGGPSARSGHRMCVVKGRLIIFGGYIDLGFGGDNKYLNDMFSIDLNQDEFKWVKAETSVVDVVPSVRSGFQWAVFDNEVILYGGYRREKVSKQASSHKTTKKGGSSASEEAMISCGVVLTDMFRLNGDTLKWQKVKRVGYGPSQRSGFTLVAHKRAFVLFGGVEDEETEESLDSKFYNDCFGWSVDRKRFYPMNVRKKKRGGGSGGRRRKRGDTASGVAAVAKAALESAAHEMDEFDEGECHEDDDEDDGAELDTAAMEASIRKQEEEEAVPCGRFNACAAVQRNILFVAGGLVEKKEADVSLDDIWSVDLNKMDEWTIVKPLSPECAEWVESDSDDDGDDNDDADDDEMECSDEDIEEDESARKKQRRKRLQDRVAVSDDYQQPRVFESLRDYHARTAPHWIGEVHEATGESGKQLRRMAFEWCYRRYWEIKPTLKELEDLEEEIAAEAKLEEEFMRSHIEAKRNRTRR